MTQEEQEFINSCIRLGVFIVLALAGVPTVAIVAAISLRLFELIRG